MYRAQTVHREHHRGERGPALHAAVGEDRRLPGGLRLLSAVLEARHGRRQRADAEGRRGPRGGGAGQGGRRHALLHGRGLARGEGRSGVRRGPGDGARRARARARGLLHAGHAHGVAGRAPGRGRADRLQPQPRHLEDLLRADHQHAHLRGPPADPGARAQGGHHRLLGRHHRHGRVAGRSRRHADDAGEPRSAARERAHQRAGGDAGHAARRSAPRRSGRAGAHDRRPRAS